MVVVDIRPVKRKRCVFSAVICCLKRVFYTNRNTMHSKETDLQVRLMPCKYLKIVPFRFIEAFGFAFQETRNYLSRS